MIPFATYQNLPNIVAGTDRKQLYERHLKVVAIRIDPCFLERGAPSDCRRQIRMVWQPVIESRGESITMDAALHSFYDLDEVEWAELLARLAPLNIDKIAGPSSLDEPLDVHPLIRAEGLGGGYWATLKKIILDFAGEKNLTRVTAMTVDPLGSIWVFSGVDLVQGAIRRIQIPGVHHIAQGFIVDITNLQELRTNIKPFPDGAESWVGFNLRFARDSWAENRSRNPFGHRARRAP